MSNSMIRFPFFPGSPDTGIPSPATSFVYPGLKTKKIVFKALGLCDMSVYSHKETILKL